MVMTHDQVMVTMFRFTLIQGPKADTYLSKPVRALKIKLSHTSSFLLNVITLDRRTKETWFHV